jgi:hypothetical protein
MVKKKKQSIVDKLLIAAIDLETDGKRPFTAEDLVVNAWKNFPDAFGLSGYLDERGYRKYPDSNRVFAEIMGSKPIRKKGYLQKVGTKMYHLTEAGQGQARQLSAIYNGRGDTKSDTGKSGIDRTMVLKIKRLFSSKVFEKYIGQRTEEITFYDACAFWGITPRSSAIELESSIANFKNVIKTALKDAKGKKLSFQHGGRAYSPKELNLLIDAHELLMKKYKQQIDSIMKRKDERLW